MLIYKHSRDTPNALHATYIHREQRTDIGSRSKAKTPSIIDHLCTFYVRTSSDSSSEWLQRLRRVFCAQLQKFKVLPSDGKWHAECNLFSSPLLPCHSDLALTGRFPAVT